MFHSHCYCPGAGLSVAPLELSLTPQLPGFGLLQVREKPPHCHKSLPLMNILCLHGRSELKPASSLTSLTSVPQALEASNPQNEDSPASNTSLPGELLFIHQNPMTFSFINSSIYCVPRCQRSSGEEPGLWANLQLSRVVERTEKESHAHRESKVFQLAYRRDRTGDIGDLGRVQVTRAFHYNIH